MGFNDFPFQDLRTQNTRKQVTMVKYRKMTTKIFVTFALCILARTPVQGGVVVNDDLIVETSKGKVQGFETSTSDNKKVSAWYGIPYAQPPTGNLRFRHPGSVDHGMESRKLKTIRTPARR